MIYQVDNDHNITPILEPNPKSIKLDINKLSDIEIELCCRF